MNISALLYDLASNIFFSPASFIVGMPFRVHVTDKIGVYQLFMFLVRLPVHLVLQFLKSQKLYMDFQLPNPWFFSSQCSSCSI